MDNLSNLNKLNVDRSNADQSSVEKFIVFQVANHYFALPIDQVLRVINYCSSTSTVFNSMGLIQIGRYTVRLLDLQSSFDVRGVSSSPAHQPFLVISRNSQGDLYGIPVDAPPDVMEFPPDLMQPIPSFDNHYLSKMISHAAVLPDNTATIFLLNIK